MPSHAARRFLIVTAVSKGYTVQTWDTPGACMRAPKDPWYRQTMQPPPEFDGTCAAPGKICLMSRAMQGAPNANGLWDCRDHGITTWGWENYHPSLSDTQLQQLKASVRCKRRQMIS